MKQILIYPVGATDACAYAGAYLEQAGLPLTDHPSPEVTHVLLAYMGAIVLTPSSRLSYLLNMEK